MVNERPILFSGEMVRAILDGRKSMTRRVVNLRRAKDKALADFALERAGDEFIERHCPYGQPGDRLWLRERQRVTRCRTVDAFEVRVTYQADGAESPWIEYPARLRGKVEIGKCLAYGGFRESSRIDLEVTGVRVERVQDISGEDALAEGISIPRCGCDVCAHSSSMCPADATAAIEEFAVLWDSINASRGHPWANNDWVWVVEFKVAEVRR